MAEGSQDVLTYSVKQGKCYITLNRPKSMNALNAELRSAIVEAVQKFDQDEELFVGIITGAGGKAFSAGLDLKEVASKASKDEQEGKAHRNTGVSASEALSSSRKPIIAAIDGYCLAGGFEIALSCDIRIATTQSTFGLPEVRRSLLPGPGLHELPRVVPLGEALLIQLTGSPISSERAYQIGLIQKLVSDRDELMAEADKIADDILKGAPLATKAIKRVVRVGRNLPIEYSAKFSEAYRDAVYLSEDRREGPKAFAEKREPQWKNR
jgi:enoyl-CoA hydratase/carnithine racemase